MNKNLKPGDRITIKGLITRVEGFDTIGNNQMVKTPMGDFNIDLVKRFIAKKQPEFAQNTIKVYSEEDYELIYNLAYKGRDMAQVARHLGISFRRFWIDFNNPNLDVQTYYQAGADLLDEETFDTLKSEASNPKNSKALVAFIEHQNQMKLKNKINAIQQQNNIW
jgi:hypothetical protein